MEQQLMQRHNAGENDSSDVMQAKEMGKDFSNLTFNDMQEKKCAICLKKLKLRKGAISILPCQHALHDDCLSDLKKHNFTSCPQCKKKYKDCDEENENNCIMCILKTKNRTISFIEKSSDDLLQESHDCITNPKDYLEQHIVELRSFLGNIWSSYGEDN